MALTANIEKGMVIINNNSPCLIIEREFYKPGKGNAIIRIRIKDLKNGNVISQTYRSGDKVDEVDVTTKSMQYVYSDDKNAHFMDAETFEQVEVNLDLIPYKEDFLHVDGHYVVLIYENQAISVKLPPKITLEVVETSEGARGNTATNATKEAKLETGATVQVPLFVKTGDKIIVNTDMHEYVSKA